VNHPWTIPSMAPPAIPVLGNGLVFQTLGSDERVPVLAFSMTVPSYLRRRLRNLIRFEFSFF
jgi:hypothetical protein